MSVSRRADDLARTVKKLQRRVDELDARASRVGHNHGFKLLAEATADGSSTTLAVTSIPQTHKDLLVMIQGSNNNAAAQFRTVSVRLNNNSTANSYRYVWTRISDSGSGSLTVVSSQGNTLWTVGGFGDKNNLSSLRLEIPNYTTAVQKAASWQVGGSIGSGVDESRTTAGTGQHAQSAAVSSIQFIMTTDNWQSGSTLRVYGLGVA